MNIVKEMIQRGADIHSRNQKNQDLIEFIYATINEELEDDEIKPHVLWKYPNKRSDFGKQFQGLYQCMKEIYPESEFLDKCKNADFIKQFLSYSDQNSILDYLELLHVSGYDFSQKLDKSGNSILHYAAQTCFPSVINKLKEWNCDFKIKNAEGKTPSDHLINNTIKILSRLKTANPDLFLDNIKLSLNSVQDTLQALGADMDLIKDKLFLACSKLKIEEFTLHAQQLFKVDNNH